MRKGPRSANPVTNGGRITMWWSKAAASLFSCTQRGMGFEASDGEETLQVRPREKQEGVIENSKSGTAGLLREDCMEKPKN